MITEHMPAACAEVNLTTPAPVGSSGPSARPLVAPVPPAVWAGTWSPDEEIWKTAAKVAASS